MDTFRLGFVGFFLLFIVLMGMIAPNPNLSPIMRGIVLTFVLFLAIAHIAQFVHRTCEHQTPLDKPKQND